MSSLTTAVRRRPLPAAAGLAVVLFLVVVGWLGATGLLARGHLGQVRSEVSGLRADVSSGRTYGLGPRLDSLRHESRAARRLTSDPVWRLAAHLPLVGGTFGTSSGLSRVTDELADRALPQLVDAAAQLHPQEVRRADGSLDLSRLRGAYPHLVRADAAIAETRRQVADLPRRGAISPVGRARQQLSDQLSALASSVDVATRTARVGPTMLGGAGARRYLVILQNPAEVRGTGGLAGAFAVIGADSGRLHRERTGSDTDLRDSDSPAVELGPEYDARWRAAGGDRAWTSANATPHYPWAAQVWARLWHEQTGQTVDGVIAVDPVALGYLLEATGPVTLSNGEVLAGSTVARWTLSTEYFEYDGDNAQRKKLLTELAEKAFDRLSSGSGGSGALFGAFGRAAGERRILVWAARPEEQSVVMGTPSSGTPLDADGPLAALVLNNGGGNKLDYYTGRTLTYRVLSCTTTTRTVRTTITLTNGAPTSGLPVYVGGRADGRAAPLGTSRTLVALYITSGAELGRASRDGAPISLIVGQERGHPVLQTVEELHAGQSSTVEFEYTEPRSRTALAVPEQPMARRMTVEIQNGCS